MNIFRSKEDSLKFGLSFFLLAGSVAGTWFCNQMTEEMKTELLVLGQSAVTKTSLEQMDWQELFLQILPERIWGVLLLMLAASTPVADWCMRFAVGYIGFSNAVFLCILTMEYGVSAPLRYLILLFPHCICYILIGYLLMWWIPAKEKRFTLGSILFLLGLVCVGGLLESLVNPRILTWF